MQILSPDQLEEAAVMLKKGKILVFPTETSYGLGCDATNQSAVDKIFKIKERSADKQLMMVVPEVEMAKKYLAWNSLVDRVAIKYWPGPVTVVAEYIGNILKAGLGKIQKVYLLANGVVSDAGTLAVRVTAHPVVKFLSEKLGRPLVATSANIAGAGEIYDSQKLVKVFSTRAVQPDALVDNGLLPHHLPTTLVRIRQGKLEILRQGEVKIEIY